MLATILTIVIVLTAIFLIVAFFVKREFLISRDITINKPKQVVFDYIKYLKNQDNFSKWVMTDPNMKKDFKGTDGTVGFTYAWDSKNKQAGKGEQEIIKIIEAERVDVEVRFEKPFKSTANTPFLIQSVTANQTMVKWGMSGISPYPRNIFNLFMDKMLGKDLEISLVNLKAILEKS